MRGFTPVMIVLALASSPSFAFFGTEMAPLLQLVAGQVQEIERLAETVGMAKDQITLLKQLNEGIGQTVSQIQSIQSVMERAQGLDPRELKSLADLNDLLERAKGTQVAIEEMLAIKVEMANQAIARSALQSDTTYRMGQEMVFTGSQLAAESQTASPGRANQISAAASSAQVLSQGVELQTMAQMVQLQALLLEFQKGQMERELRSEKIRRAQYEMQLAVTPKRTKR